MNNENADSTLVIDLGAIKSNYEKIKNLSPNAITGAVVKADAYGLGVEPVSKKLQSAGCKDFFVATLDEAVELRGILPSENIYVFHGVGEGQEPVFLDKNLIPVLNTSSQVERWNNVKGEKPPAILHFDTGINRLGLNMSEAEGLNISNIEIKYIMSHLACAATPENPKNKEQLENFNKIKASFPDVPATLCNSGGVLLGEDYHFDLTRPGISLYASGVVTLKSKIIQVREVESAGAAGYGATYEVKAGSKLAVVPVGYADGYMRSLSNNSFAYIGDIKVPIAGIVSMDMIILDVSDAGDVNIGDEVELIGDNFTVDMMADMAKTISYEVLTGLGSRYKRVYLNG